MKFPGLTLLFFLLFIQAANCQFAEIRFSSNSPVYVSVDGIMQNSKGVNELSLQNLKAGNHFFQIELENTDSVLGFNYTADNFFLYEFVILSMSDYEEANNNMAFLVSSDARIFVYCKSISEMEKSPELFESSVNSNFSDNPNLQITTTQNYSHQAYHTDSTTDNHADVQNTVSIHYQQQVQYNTNNSSVDYTGPVGCQLPIDEKSYASTLNTIKTKDFEDTKLKIAKQISSANCLSVEQIIGIMKLFDFEDNRLDFAKFAYHYVFDKGNYFMVNDLFDFESSTDDLINYINNCNNE